MFGSTVGTAEQWSCGVCLVLMIENMKTKPANQMRLDTIILSIKQLNITNTEMSSCCHQEPTGYIEVSFQRTHLQLRTCVGQGSTWKKLVENICQHNRDTQKLACVFLCVSAQVEEGIDTEGDTGENQWSVPVLPRGPTGWSEDR